MIKLPVDFEQQMSAQLKEDFPSFVNALSEPAPVSIRWNPRKIKAEPKGESVLWCSHAEYLPERPSFTLDPLFHAGAYYVQEASSMFLAELVRQNIDLSKPLKVLDLCAAPGGKSTLLADLLNDQSLLLSNEVIKSRVGVLRENLQKWGWSNYLVSNHDSEDFAELEGFFDVVLVDAPCSGEGLFRKDQEAMSHWSLQATQACSARQQRILEAAALTVAPGGYLIYSTCTYNSLENEQNVEWIQKMLGFEILKIDVKNFEGLHADQKGLQFYPHKVKGEGFYCAILKKKDGFEDFVSAKVRLPRISKNQHATLKPWIKEPDKFEFFTKADDQQVIAIPVDLMSEYGTIHKALFKRSLGMEIGQFKGTDFIPSHALALSVELHENIEKVDLDKENALKFLKREPFEAQIDAKGWALISHQGLGLGWVKNLGGRVNNYLPKEWRIRMDLE